MSVLGGCIFFQGRLVTFAVPYPHPAVLCFSPRGLEPGFPSPRKRVGIVVNTELHPWIVWSVLFSVILFFSPRELSMIHIDTNPSFDS